MIGLLYVIPCSYILLVTALDSCESETVNTYAENTNSNAYLVQSSKSFILLSGNMKQTAIPILITHNYFVLDALLKPDSPVSAFSVTYLFLAGTYSLVSNRTVSGFVPVKNI